jgi:hypothetical protein
MRVVRETSAHGRSEARVGARVEMGGDKRGNEKVLFEADDTRECSG